MTAATATPVHRPPAIAQPSASEARGHQGRWLLAGLALAFSIPFVLTDLTSINCDLYYGACIVGVFGFVAAWLRCCRGSTLYGVAGEEGRQ